MAAQAEFATLQAMIYNDSSRFPGGMLSVQLNQNFYEPGETLVGMIYISTLVPFQCEAIQLNVESEEKAEFTRFWHEQVPDGQNEDGSQRYRTVERSERCDEKREGFDFKAKLMDFEAYGNMIQPGNYCIQFSFVLPNPLPASFKLKKTNERADPKAKVEHDLKVKLVGTNFDDTPSFKQEFKVRNDKSRFTGNKLERMEDKEVVCCFCMGKGTAKCAATMEKEFFYRNEDAECAVSIDNTQVEVDNTNISFQVVQHLKL